MVRGEHAYERHTYTNLTKNTGCIAVRTTQIVSVLAESLYTNLDWKATKTDDHSSEEEDHELNMNH